MALELRSPAFEQDQTIPEKYTCSGPDVSVPLEWRGAPKETAAFALVADDPDAPAGTWVHWVLYDLPAGAASLPEDLSPDEDLDSGAHQGMNDFRRVGYGGPCPPSGPPHRYFFKLYALDEKTGLRARATKRDLEKAIEGHILAEAQLVGRYQRS